MHARTITDSAAMLATLDDEALLRFAALTNRNRDERDDALAILAHRIRLRLAASGR